MKKTMPKTGLLIILYSLAIFSVACNYASDPGLQDISDGDLADGDQESSNDSDPEPEVDADLEPPVDGDQESERTSDGDIVSDGDATSDGDAEEEIAPNSAAILGELRTLADAGGHTSYFELYDEPPVRGDSIPLNVTGENPPSVPIDGGVAYPFKLEFLSSGTYWVIGGVDLNDDGQYIETDGELAFAADHPFVLSPGQVISDARIYLNFEDPVRGSVSGTLTVPERYDALSYSVMVFDHEVDIDTTFNDQPVAEAELTSNRSEDSTIDFRIVNLAGGTYYLYSQVNPCEGLTLDNVRVGVTYANNPLVIDLDGEKDLSGKDLDYSSENLICPGVPQGRLCGSVRAPSDYATMMRSIMLFDQAPGNNVFPIVSKQFESTVDNGDASVSFPFCFDNLIENDYWIVFWFDKNRNEAMDPDKQELDYYGSPPYHLSEGEDKTLEPSFFDIPNPDLGRIAGTVLTGVDYLQADGFSYNVALFDAPFLPGNFDVSDDNLVCPLK